MEILSQWFNLTDVVHIPTVNQIRAALAADNDPSLLLGPVVQGDPNIIEVRARFTMVIPHKYVGLFLLQLEGVTPRYYFETILPVMEADGLAADCAPLTRFCQIAITRHLMNGNSMLEVNSPVPPHWHIALLTQAHGILSYHLPCGYYTWRRVRQEKAQAALEKLTKTNTTVAM